MAGGATNAIRARVIEFCGSTGTVADALAAVRGNQFREPIKKIVRVRKGPSEEWIGDERRGQRLLGFGWGNGHNSEFVSHFIPPG